MNNRIPPPDTPVELIRLLVVDDHALVRSGIRQVLSSESQAYFIGEAGDCASAMQQLHELAWDLVLLDVNLPGQGGLECLKRMRREWPDLQVLMLSMHSEQQYAVRAIRAGAAGYLAKGRGLEELVSAIGQVAAGHSYITPTLAQTLASGVSGRGSGEPHQGLSDREFQVLCLIASGRTISQIAEDIALSVKTVSTYRARLLAKMDLKTNAELVHYAVSRGLA